MFIYLHTFFIALFLLTGNLIVNNNGSSFPSRLLPIKGYPWMVQEHPGYNLLFVALEVSDAVEASLLNTG